MALEGPINRATLLCLRYVRLIMRSQIKQLTYITQPYISIAARMAVELELFKHITSSADTITSSQLASASGGEETLICKLRKPSRSVLSLNFAKLEFYVCSQRSTS